MFSSLSSKKRSTVSSKPLVGKHPQHFTPQSKPDWTLIEPFAKPRQPSLGGHSSIHSTLHLPSTPPPRLPTPALPFSSQETSTPTPITPITPMTPMTPHHSSPPPFVMPKLHTSPSRPGLRKSRQNPTLNVILAGARETGKTCFVSSFLGSFGAYAPEELDQPVPTKKFREYSAGSVSGLTGEKIVLTVVDTPGLEIQSNDELTVEHQVNQIIHYLEDRFEGSLQQERKVKRQPVRLGDTHLHCCLYFLHPSVLEPAQTAFRSTDPTQAQSARIKMARMDIRAMRRIAKRANVFPIIGRADELTVTQLESVRNWIRSELRGQQVDLSVLTGMPGDSSSSSAEDLSTDTAPSTSSPTTPISHQSTPPQAPKPRRAVSSYTSSAAARRVRVNLNINRAEEQLLELLPLTVISPQEHVEALGTESVNELNRMNPLSGPAPNKASEWQQGDNGACRWDFRGFSRTFKWGTIDILDPNHCDFVLLRAVLLGTHLTRLKDCTLEKYEAYRTERLIRRERFTKVLTSEEEAKLMMEMEMFQIPKVAPVIPFSVGGGGNRNIHGRQHHKSRGNGSENQPAGPIVR